jgi:hypothetical protein
MKLLPESPLDSSPLGAKRGEGAVILRKVLRSNSCSLKKRREKEEGERDPMHLVMQKTGDPNHNHPNPNPNKTPPPRTFNKTKDNTRKRSINKTKDKRFRVSVRG